MGHKQNKKRHDREIKKKNFFKAEEKKQKKLSKKKEETDIEVNNMTKAGNR